MASIWTMGEMLVEIIVVKRGSTIYTPSEEIEIPAYQVVEVDPTGAGDCFDGAFLCGLLENRPLDVCEQIASAVGAPNAGAFTPVEGKISQSAVEEVIRQGYVSH